MAKSRPQFVRSYAEIDIKVDGLPIRVEIGCMEKSPLMLTYPNGQGVVYRGEFLPLTSKIRSSSRRPHQSFSELEGRDFTDVANAIRLAVEERVREDPLCMEAFFWLSAMIEAELINF